MNRTIDKAIPVPGLNFRPFDRHKLLEGLVLLYRTAFETQAI